jgi:hypothetical protein
MYISANRDRRLPNFMLNADETLAALGLSRVNTATMDRSDHFALAEKMRDEAPGNWRLSD